MEPTSDRAAEQQERVRLYVFVILLVDLLAYASDAVGALLVDELAAAPLQGTPRLVRWGVTAGVVSTWTLLKVRALPIVLVIAVEIAVSLGLAVSYVSVALGFVDIKPLAPVFGLLGIILILVVRSSLVPSTVLRTALTGFACLAILLIGAAPQLRELPATVSDGIVFMGIAIVVATSVSSRVIYGLRERVRDMTRLGQYTLESKVGEGGMGVVYRARHGMLRRPTAVKLLPPDRASEKDVTRFEREVRLTARLTHPNTVTVFDYGRTPDGVFYYAMELLDGATLDDIVAVSGPQPPARVHRILLDCAGALHEAHSIGLIHRDIKPSNIMLCQQGGRTDVVKLLDFGLVKELTAGDASPIITGASTIIGTPLYLSPEGIRDPDRVDGRSDLYALGAVAYFLVTGCHVFEGDSVIDTCLRHLHDEPRPPSERLGTAVDSGLEDLILRCLAKDPADRPASAEELRRALVDLETGGAIDGPFDADRWWRDNAALLAGRRPEDDAVSVAGRTIAVDRRGDTESARPADG